MQEEYIYYFKTAHQLGSFLYDTNFIKKIEKNLFE